MTHSSKMSADPFVSLLLLLLIGFAWSLDAGDTEKSTTSSLLTTNITLSNNNKSEAAARTLSSSEIPSDYELAVTQLQGGKDADLASSPEAQLDERGYDKIHVAVSPYKSPSSSYDDPPPLSTITTTLSAKGGVLGRSCYGDAACTKVVGAKCVHGICSCSPSDFVPFSNITCLKKARQLGDKCQLTAQCVDIDPLALCYADVCLCEPLYFVAGNGGTKAVATSKSVAYGTGKSASPISCIKKAKLYEPCTDTVQCAYQVPNSQCDAKWSVCKCKSGYVPIGDSQCAPLATALGQRCTVAAQCKLISRADCGLSGTCECSDRGERNVQVAMGGNDRRRKKRQVAGGELWWPESNNNQMCVPAVNLGDMCTVTAQCKKITRNSDCIQGRCRCVSGFIQRDPYVNECLPLISGIHSQSCTISGQCLAYGAFCKSTTNKCDCDRQHCAVNYMCLPRVWNEEPCKDSCQCSVPNSVCRFGFCQCNDRTCYSSAVKQCLPKALQFNANPFQFVAPSCGGLPPLRCIGQVTLNPTWLNCTAKPTFSISVTSTSSVPLTIDSNGLICIRTTSFARVRRQAVQVQTIQDVEVTTPITATVTATTPDGLVATTLVIISPSACATQIPAPIRTADTTVLVRTPAENGDCFNNNANTNVVNAVSVFNVNSIFGPVCGEAVVISFPVLTPSASGFAPTTGNVPSGCFVTPSGFVGFTGTIPVNSRATCNLLITATACTGKVANVPFQLVLICPAAASIPGPVSPTPTTSTEESATDKR